MGGIYNDVHKFDLALNCFEKALKIRRKSNNKASIGVSLNNIGLIHSGRGNHVVALRYYKDSLKIKQDYKDHNGQAVTLDNIGCTYLSLGNICEALRYTNKSLALSNKIGNIENVAVALNSMGSIYLKARKFDEAIKAFEESIIISERTKNMLSHVTALNNLGNANSENLEYRKALDYFFKSFKMQRENTSIIFDFPEKISAIAYRIAEISYVHMRDYITTVPYAHFALKNFPDSDKYNLVNNITESIGSERFELILSTYKIN